MTNSYASTTKVDTGRSKAEIERTLERFGASASMFARDDDAGVFVVSFRRAGRAYRFILPMPKREAFKYTKPRYSYEQHGRHRADSAIDKSIDQETKRRFRSLSNFIKATLDAIDTKIIDFDTAMLPHLVLPDGRTVSQALEPQVESALEGRVPTLSLALPPGTVTVSTEK